MQRVTIRFVRDGSDEREDDVIRIFDTDCNDLFRVTFQAHDTDPFESLQVETAIHPAILYHISDFDEQHVRRLVEDTVDSALFRTVVKTDTE
jgi:hypothetical protein